MVSNETMAYIPAILDDIQVELTEVCFSMAGSLGRRS